MFDKIRKPRRILLSVLLIFSTVISPNVHAQDTIIQRPPVTNSWKDYKEQVKADPSKQMLELSSNIPGLQYDLRYASSNNFMKRIMYPKGTSKTFMRIPAVKALQQVQLALKEKGLGLKIFDAYRPYYVTILFWELVKDERYVANPAKGSGHNRGIAVDLTIINLSNGQELDMGTGFDNFSDTAHADYKKLPTQVLENRKTLRSQMEKNGFKVLDTEWWHFYLPDASRYEILDLDFKKLQKRF